ncbi:uncharacterized protein A4U43_C07F610 [Asparagus officinalis]|uniref:SHSP domain-containing protein n=1 Tax=Asparagus officinalis TaxID=4686 RepID=A0A5P1E897_ASPOF|nr:uncharacterized protein A4U43_C07F610 [Asparagus officinalis]
MSMIPSFGGFGFGFPGRNPSGIFDPFGDDFFLPFSPFGDGAVSFPRANDVAAFAGARMELEGDGGGARVQGRLPGFERSSGSFVRRFGLPEGAKVDQVKAAMEDGVLTVTVPKVGGGRRPM